MKGTVEKVEMAELLVELLSEEIPARMQLPMAEMFKKSVEARLQKNELKHRGVRTFVGPRRLVLHVDGLPVKQEDTTIERRGPRVDAPQQAIDGFLRANNLALDQVTRRQQDKGEFFFAVITQKGKFTREVLGTALAEIIPGLTWPKSMRWGDTDIRWVRPLKNILALFDGQVLPVRFGHLRATRISAGHRFLSPGTFEVSDFAGYVQELEKRHVVLDAAKRRAIITEQAEKLATGNGLVLLQDQGLLTEVAGLVEWPVVLSGRIDDAYMQMPEEVLLSSIRTHQKYFCLRTQEGALAPHFLVVANMDTSDNGAGIVAGNERVLRARLADAAFFWDQDRKVPLEKRMEDLEKVIFHARLGTVAAKVKRIQALAGFLTSQVPGADPDKVQRASLLCKADLVTEMVGEFPELQGIMGGYYACEAGESATVAAAIKEHYAPLGPADVCPQAAVSAVVALADKIDTLVGLFAANEKPTGSKDPFALRRAALGVIRIVLENEFSLPLRPVFEFALEQYPASLLEPLTNEDAGSRKKEKKAPKAKTPEDLFADLLSFFGDRLKAALRGQEVRHDLITAVFDGSGQDDLLRVMQRVRALERFLETDNGANLHSAYKRATNIVRIEEKKDKTTYAGEPLEALLEQNEEKTLFASLQEIKFKMPQTLAEYRYEEAMVLLAELRGSIDTFFDEVIVNCEQPELRQNRLRLLAQMRAILDAIANFTLIEG